MLVRACIFYVCICPDSVSNKSDTVVVVEFLAFAIVVVVVDVVFAAFVLVDVAVLAVVLVLLFRICFSCWNRLK